MTNTMKRLTFPFMLCVMLVSSCNNDQDQSDAFGNFEAVDVMVAAEAQGKLIAFTPMEGQEINEGEIVGVIDTTQLFLKKQQLLAAITTLQTKVKTLDAQVKANVVQMENLEREYNRLLNLLEDGAATSKQKDDMDGNIKVLKAQIAALETQKATISAERNTLKIQIAQVNDQIKRSQVKNPISGVVLQKYKEQGEIVGAGQNLYKIADLDKLILRVYVSGDQLSTVKIGEEVTVRIDGTEGIEELPGLVTWVSSQAEFTPKIIQTKEERINLVYAVKVVVENDGMLKIGMPGEIKL